MKFLTFTALILVSSSAISDERGCAYLKDNTYWEETVLKCNKNCVFDYNHNINIYFGGKKDLGSSKVSSNKSFSHKEKTFTDYKIGEGYYDLSRGKKISDGVYEVCGVKKSKEYLQRKKRIKREDKLKEDIKSIPIRLRDFFIGMILPGF